jgi:hypothetical protein
MRRDSSRGRRLTQRWADTLCGSEDSRGELDGASKDYENLRTEFNELVRPWNRYIEMGGRQPVGRPLQATDAQIAEVRKPRNAGAAPEHRHGDHAHGRHHHRATGGHSDVCALSDGQ